MRLRRAGYEVIIISRSPGQHKITWDSVSREGLPTGTKAVINLAGQNVLDPFRQIDTVGSRKLCNRKNTFFLCYKASGFSSTLNPTYYVLSEWVCVNCTIAVFNVFNTIQNQSLSPTVVFQFYNFMGLIVDFVDRWIFYNYMACDHILSTLVSIDRKSVFYSIILFPAPQKTINKIYLQILQFPFCLFKSLVASV